jgi:hypothetical protein
MRIVRLKCESDQANYDQTIREVAAESEDETNWYGRPVANPACLTLQWPKFAWKEVPYELSDDDIQENELSLKEGLRLLSNYRTAKGQRLWIITEADRSATTMLLPSEY